METTSRKKEVFICFKDDLVAALEYSREHSLQNNAIHLSGAAHIIWNEIFEKHWDFTGSFTDNCQNESVSAWLLSLIPRIIGSSYDPNSQNKLKIRIYRQFESDGVICVTKLCSNVFTTFAVDNIDHNPNSRFAKYSWHETAISSTQHLESKTDGIKRCSV